MVTAENGLTLLERLRAAAELLEAIAEDRKLLEQVPVGDRQRLHLAIAQVYHPDAAARRRMLKDQERERTTQQNRCVDAVLSETGIRSLRRKPVFTTPNCFPPRDFEERQSAEPLHCYVCKQKYTQVHHFYDQMCPECAEFNFAKRSETADLTRTCGAADRRPRQDRLPGGAEASARRSTVDRDHTLSP